MNAVGIDVSKGKSTVAVLRPFGEGGHLRKARFRSMRLFLFASGLAYRIRFQFSKRTVKLFIKALTEINYIDNLLDCFISDNKEDVAILIKDETGRITDIEKMVRKFSKQSAELVM